MFSWFEIGAESLSERELSEEPVQHSPKGAWYRTKPGIGAIAAAAVIAIGLGGYRYFQIREIDARFLISTPDTVPNKPELVSFALPRGKSAFEKNCASCHGTTMKGDPLKGIPNLTDNDYLYGSGRVSQIERIIMYGIRSGNSKGWDLASMPAFGTEHPYPRYKVIPLSPEELDDITDYIYSFQHPPKTVDEKLAVVRGEAIYRNYLKGVCWDCHANDALGDTAIGAPDLVDNIWLYGDGSKAWIHHTIAHGLEGYCPAFIDRLSPVTIRAIAVYVHSKEPPPAPTQTASAGSVP